jgi:PRC-barrel domain
MLRSVNNLHGYSIVAADGPIGSVEELYFDDERWAIRYFVVDTGKWLPGSLVLVSPFAIQRADRSEGALHLSISREQVPGRYPPFKRAEPASARNRPGRSVLGYPPAPHNSSARPPRARQLETGALSRYSLPF